MLRTALACAALLPFCAAAHGGTIFVSNEKDNTVTVIDSETLKVVKTIATGARPRGMIMTPDFKKLIVCAGDDNRLDIIDTTTFELERSLDSGPDPELLDIDSKGDRIYVANEDDGMVTVLQFADGNVLAEIPVGVEPEGMAVSQDDRITVATSEQTSSCNSFALNRFSVAKRVGWSMSPCSAPTEKPCRFSDL